MTIGQEGLLKLPFSKSTIATKGPTSFLITQARGEGVKGIDVDPIDYLYHDVRIIAIDGTVVEGECFSVDYRYDIDADEDKLDIRIPGSRSYLMIGPSEIDTLYDLGAYAEL